jgi:hypothetical protein
MRLTCLRLLVVAGLVLLAAACGGGDGTGGGRAKSAGQSVGLVVIVIVPPTDPLPFDPRSARLAQATRQLTDIVGEPVTFELDAALLPEYRASFEDELITAIENVARDLDDLRESAPRAFARASKMLGKVACRYKATASWATAVLEPATRTVTITEPPDQRTLVGRGLVLRAIEDELDMYLDRRYRTATPGDIPPDERAAYFEYLTRTRPGAGNIFERRVLGELQGPDRNVRELEAHGEVLLKVAQLGDLVGKSAEPLAVEVRAYLAQEAQYLEHRTMVSRAEIEGLPKDSTWRRAEAAYVRWLTNNAAALTDRWTANLVDVMFPARAACRPFEPCTDVPTSFPGFDRFAFGLALVDAWRTEGRPRDGTGEHFEMLDRTVCPHRATPDGKRTRNRGCSSAFYLQAVATPATRQRLVAALVQRHDPMLVEEVFLNLEQAPPERVIDTWRSLEREPPEWQAATGAVLDYLLARSELEAAILEEANQLWKRSPDRRGVALFAIAWKYRGFDRHYADPNMADFGKRYGAPVSRDELAQLAELGPRAMPLVPVVWPALAKGFSPGEVVAPHLGAFLSQSRATSNDPTPTLRALISRMCEGGDTRGLARVHAALEERTRAHAEDAPGLATFLVDTTGCKPSR